ncbi:MAG: heavy metal translocating P-type ATPase metal-binding domain-containing protein [Oxalobacteraceae bacterium]
MQRFQFLDEKCQRATRADAMMRTLLSALTAMFAASAASNPKVACFHCGELVRQKRVVHVVFDGVCRDVCCHGCAAILSTVEQLGQCEPYLAQKQQSEMPDA